MTLLCTYFRRDPKEQLQMKIKDYLLACRSSRLKNALARNAPTKMLQKWTGANVMSSSATSEISSRPVHHSLHLISFLYSCFMFSFIPLCLSPLFFSCTQWDSSFTCIFLNQCFLTCDFCYDLFYDYLSSWFTSISLI